MNAALDMMGNRVLPDAHAWSWDTRQLDSAGETFVTLRIIILEADLYGKLTDGVPRDHELIT